MLTAVTLKNSFYLLYVVVSCDRSLARFAAACASIKQKPLFQGSRNAFRIFSTWAACLQFSHSTSALQTPN